MRKTRSELIGNQSGSFGSRKLCQFSTPDIIAENMIRWAITTGSDSVLDPCCGNSNLLEKALARLVYLGSTPAQATSLTYGVEISKRTTRIAIARLLTKYGPTIPHIITKDFLSVEAAELHPVKAIVCNPPYKRHQDLTSRYKLAMARKIQRESGIEIPKTSNLYVHFLIHASHFLAEGGRMVFLLPSQYLSNRFGKALRKFLSERFRIHGIILFDERLSIFPKVESTASLVLIQKVKPTDNDTTIFAKLESLETDFDLLKIMRLDRMTSTTIRTIRRSQLEMGKKWIQFFYRSSLPAWSTTLGAVARVKRGIATGANNFFLLSNALVNEKGLHSRFLRPVLAKTSHAHFPDFNRQDWKKLRDDGKPVWILSCYAPKISLRDERLLTYIRTGEESDYDKRYLTSQRHTWYSIEKREPAQILFTYMSNGRPRFIYNKARVLTTNAFHGIYPNDEIISDETKTKTLLAILNSSYTMSKLTLLGRTYSGGLLKLEPSETASIPIPDIGNLQELEMTNLASFFDELCETCRASNSWDTRKIDRTVKSIAKRRLMQPKAPMLTVAPNASKHTLYDCHLSQSHPNLLHSG